MYQTRLVCNKDLGNGFSLCFFFGGSQTLEWIHVSNSALSILSDIAWLTIRPWHIFSLYFLLSLFRNYLKDIKKNYFTFYVVMRQLPAWSRCGSFCVVTRAALFMHLVVLCLHHVTDHFFVSISKSYINRFTDIKKVSLKNND